jgi:hypothetical protein
MFWGSFVQTSEYALFKRPGFYSMPVCLPLRDKIYAIQWAIPDGAEIESQGNSILHFYLLLPQSDLAFLKFVMQ